MSAEVPENVPANPSPGSHGDEPAEFAFTEENMAYARRIIAKYPEGRQASALMPLLDLAQRQNANWLHRAAMDYVADLLGMPRMRVYEVATFYTMYNLKPVGRHFVQVCTTTPCMLRGADEVLHACERKLGIQAGETTPDGQFTVIEVECLGACVNAPMMQINDDFYEDLDAEGTERVLDALARGETVPPGSVKGRHGSCPEGGPTTLKEYAREAGIQTAGGDD
jgi:NADH-quinone oxidoreductase E subunit